MKFKEGDKVIIKHSDGKNIYEAIVLNKKECKMILSEEQYYLKIFTDFGFTDKEGRHYNKQIYNESVIELDKKYYRGLNIDNLLDE